MTGWLYVFAALGTGFALVHLREDDLIREFQTLRPGKNQIEYFYNQEKHGFLFKSF